MTPTRHLVVVDPESLRRRVGEWGLTCLDLDVVGVHWVYIEFGTIHDRSRRLSGHLSTSSSSFCTPSNPSEEPPQEIVTFGRKYTFLYSRKRILSPRVLTDV